MTSGKTPSTCPECDGRLRRSTIETRCEDCGLVHEEHAIDPGPEWRSFEDDGDRNRKRTGGPLTRSRHDRGLSTEIGHGTGSRVTGRKRRRLRRLRREHNRARISTTADRNQVYGFTEIRRIVDDLSLSTTVRDRSCTLFDTAQSEGLLQGRSIEGFAAAAVYATCRAMSIARRTDELVAVSRADEAELLAAYDAMNRELGLPTGPIDPVEYLPRYASALEVGHDAERRAREYATTLLEGGHVGGKNPSGVAAACLYAAVHDADVDADAEVTQAAAADVADVASVTIRSTVSDLREVLAGEPGRVPSDD